MVRTAFFVLLTLLLPTLAADATVATLDSGAGCRASMVPVDVPGCRVSHAGEATLLGCDATTCTLAVTVDATAVGLPAGAQSIESAVVTDERQTLCSATAVATDGAALSCAGDAEVTVAVPGACRLLVIATTGVSDRVVTGNAFSELRVCREGGVTTP